MEASIALSPAKENEEFWKKHYELLKSSKLSRRQYCEQRQLNYDRFGYWISRWNRFPNNNSELVSIKLKSSEVESKSKILSVLDFKNGDSLKIYDSSALGKAMNYCINLWPGLPRFLDDGRLEIDNNLTEQEIKPFVIARKKFLFCASQDGAKALCMHMSFIRTAKLHGHDPYHYYVKLLKSIPHCVLIPIMNVQ